MRLGVTDPGYCSWGVALLLVLVVVPPLAAGDRDPGRAVATGQAAPLERLLARVAADRGGQVLKVELEWEDEDPAPGWVYEVKVLDADGQVVKLHYGAKTLELLRMSDKKRVRRPGREP